jgi:two-component system, NtrC family, response regulator GlrR
MSIPSRDSDDALSAAPANPATLGLVFVYPGNELRRIALPPGRHLVGRDPACAVPLDGRAVSWAHAELRTDEHAAVIRDLQSTNGVLLNGVPITEAPLADGSVVRLGEFLAVATPVAEEEELTPGPFREQRGLGLFIGPVLATALGPLQVAVADGRPLVIEGETGTGKKLAARLFHTESGRRGAFVAIDCGALDVVTGAHQLFGPAPGASPLDEARDGTLYLANLTALAPALQARLEAELDARRGERLGLVVGNQEPLASAVADGRLSRGLYQRLDGTKLRLPPLRRRQVEIPGLFRHLFALHGEGRMPLLSTELVERLCLYDWPCNVRELVLLVKRLSALHGDELRLRAAHLPARMLPGDHEKTTSPVTPVAGVDATSLLDALREAGGNVGRAALRLGITRERAYRLIERLGLAAGRAGA